MQRSWRRNSTLLFQKCENKKFMTTECYLWVKGRQRKIREEEKLLSFLTRFPKCSFPVLGQLLLPCTCHSFIPGEKRKKQSSSLTLSKCLPFFSSLAVGSIFLVVSFQDMALSLLTTTQWIMFAICKMINAFTVVLWIDYVLPDRNYRNKDFKQQK